MGKFFTRPDLNDIQFKQDSSSILTLSGETNVVGTFKSKNVEIDASTGSTLIGDVLTWDGSKISLAKNSGGDADIYTGATPSNIAVGGMAIGTTLTGRTISDILEEILITTYFPTLTNPSNGFSDDQANTQEVGVTIGTINFVATFNRGSINPQYPPTSSSFRSGLPNRYNYTGAQIVGNYSSTLLTDNRTATNHIVLFGANTWTNTVTYDAGVQPFDSSGNPYLAPLPSGTTGAQSVTITGIYPWFYGKSASTNPRPTAGSALLTTGVKTVAVSTGTVNANFNTVGAEWTWVAIPETSTLKTKWFVNELNQGNIGGTYPSGNKYPSPTTLSVNSPTGLWSGINYRFYISELPSIETNIEFRNS